MANAMQKIRKARAGVIIEQIFWGSLALRLKLVEDKSCESGWTDGETLGFNPEWIESLSLDQIKGFLCHEVCHCVFDHIGRRQARNSLKWNIAGDLVVNSIVDEAGFVLPSEAFLDCSYKKRSIEEVYAKLPKEEQDQKSSDPGGCGEVRDAEKPKADPNTGKQETTMKHKWKVAIVQAATISRGKVPAGLKELVGSILNPKVDWRQVLRDFVERSAKNDYTFAFPNRKYIPLGLYMPSLFSNELGDLIFAADTSGSMDSEALGQCVGELSEILEVFENCVLWFLQCDTKIHQIDRYEKADLPITFEAFGRGGTDFRPVFEWVEEQELYPKCLIYFTDLQGPMPKQKPGYPVLWVGLNLDSQVPFGEVLSIEGP